MENEASPSGAYHFLLFLLLSALLLVSAAHLLETISYSVGLTQAKPVTQQDPPDPNRASNLLIAYRILAAGTCLFLAYHCLGLKEWSRMWLVRFLAIDLVLWLVWSVWTYLAEKSPGLPPAQLTVHVLAVTLEGGLVWLLTQPEAIRHFALERKQGRIVPT